jgi:hypothetical protein
MAPFSGAESAADVASAKILVVNFRRLLSLDTDSEKQATLRKLLVEEEDKLAKNREQLEKAARLTRKGADQVREGRERLEQLNAIKSKHDIKRDTPDYRRSVDLMETIQQLFENFHRRLLNIYPYSVQLRDEIVGVCSTRDEASRRARQFARANPGRVVTIFDRSNGDRHVVGLES